MTRNTLPSKGFPIKEPARKNILLLGAITLTVAAVINSRENISGLPGFGGGAADLPENEMTPERVIQFEKARLGVELSRDAAKGILKNAKKLPIPRGKEYLEVIPGKSHFRYAVKPGTKIGVNGKMREVTLTEALGLKGEGAEVVEKFLLPIAEGKKEGELCTIDSVGGGPLRNPIGEPLLVACEAAPLMARANREMHRETGQEIKASWCFRSDDFQRIAKASVGGGGPAQDAGHSFHQTGLACDLLNGEAAQPYLLEVGMVGGCAGSMISDDFGHFSFGEMKKKSETAILTCDNSGKWGRKSQQAAERAVGKAKKYGGKLTTWGKSQINKLF